MMIKKLLLLAVVFSMLSGCSNFLNIGESEYACKGMPEGVSCMSARDVYSATENESYMTTLKAEQLATTKDKDGKGKAEGEPETRVLYVEGGDNAPIPARARNPLPIRTQAVVMRIAVDPWEDEKGDLYVPGFIYTEVEARRWEIGARTPQATPTLRPLTIVQPPQANSAK